MELLFIRHGLPETVVNSDGQPADPPLSSIGHEQAATMAAWVEPFGIDAIYSSPMQRAMQTAAPLASAVGSEPIVRERLSEYDRNASAYIPMEDQQRADPTAWRELTTADLLDDIDDPEQFMADVVAEIETIIGDHPGQRVAIVCHGGVINAYLGHLLRFPSTDFLRFGVDYTSVSRVLASSRGARNINSVNERPTAR